MTLQITEKYCLYSVFWDKQESFGMLHINGALLILLLIVLEVAASGLGHSFSMITQDFCII